MKVKKRKEKRKKEMKIKIDGREVIKTVGTGLKIAAGIGATAITKDVLGKAISENISKNVFVQIGMYAISGYVGSKAAEYIEEKINNYIEIVDIFVNAKEAEEKSEKSEETKEKENEKAN